MGNRRLGANVPGGKPLVEGSEGTASSGLTAPTNPACSKQLIPEAPRESSPPPHPHPLPLLEIQQCATPPTQMHCCAGSPGDGVRPPVIWASGRLVLDGCRVASQAPVPAFRAEQGWGKCGSSMQMGLVSVCQLAPNFSAAQPKTGSRWS